MPPLPKSLSGFQEVQNQINAVPSEEISRPISQIPQQQTSTLDTQLATLRREMVSFDIISHFKTNQNEWGLFASL